MPQTQQKQLKNFRIGPWTEGIDQKAAPWAIPHGKMSDARNLVLDEVPGYAVGRQGSVLLSNLPSGAPARDGYVYSQSNGTTYLMASDGSTLYYSVDPTVAADWTVLKTGLSASGFMAFETYEDKLYFGNGINSQMVWDGVIASEFAFERVAKHAVTR